MQRRSFLKRAVGVSVATAGWVRAGMVAGVENTPENQVIAKARQAALDVLQPTSAQLQHGLELHAASLVCESYGFSPRSAWDGAALAKAVEAGAPPAELDDLREEMSMTRCATDAAERAEYEAAWKAAGVHCIFQNAGEEGQDPVRLVKRLARYTFVTDTIGDFVSRAARPGDIVAAWRAGRRALYFTGNGVPLSQTWTNIEGELGLIRIFFQLGIRMMHVTYNRRNMLGDGCAEPANGGLSDLGRAAVAEMNRVGVIVDVAHSGWRTSLEAAKASTRPMVASHTTCDELHHHVRAKPPEVIKAIADTGGYIGICAIPSFLGGKGNIATMIDHIDHVVRKYGAERVAIGTDVAYSSRNMAAEAKKVPKTARGRPRFEYFWPPDAFPMGEASPSLAWTNWPMFTVGLVQRGHSDQTIQKIIGGNMLRVAAAAVAGIVDSKS